MNEARRYLVSGLVQGVGFRYFVLRRATERGVRGFVRNLADGRVEVYGEGSSDSLEGLRKDLEIGSKFSKVSRVDESPVAVTGRHEQFTIDG